MRKAVKQKIRIAIVDFAPKEGYLAERLLGFATDRYDFEVTENDPDFVLHSCMGQKALKFDGVRIFYTAENFTPDFNLSDYALGMDRLSFPGRYAMLPLYRLYPSYAKLFEPRGNPGQRRDHFCTCVVSNARRDALFFELFQQLGKYETLRSGGRLFNNTGGRVPDKIAFMETGRFGLAIENSVAQGYVTEKLTDVYAAGAIPIYYGAPDVCQEFNPDSFVNISDYGTLAEAVADIVAIDKSEERYNRMLQAPVFREGKEPDFLREARIKEFLYSIFDFPREQAYRRNRMIRGQIYIKKLRTAYFRPHVQATRLLRDWLRRKRKTKTFVAPLSITDKGVVYRNSP